jgi:hypothetical protein
MGVMNRLLALLSVIFFLTVAPLAYAVAHTHVLDVDHDFSDPSSSKKPDTGGYTSIAHHCIADCTRLETAEDIRQETSSNFSVITQTNPASITVGPLLEPPSRV